MLNFPTCWARATESVVTPRGDTRALTAWGWSDTSRQEAEAHARQRLAGLIERVQRGDPLPDRYAYGKRPLREQILEVIRTRSEEVAGVLTRNGYGAVVVNAARTLFVDVDLPDDRRWFGGLFGRDTRYEETRQRVKQALQPHGSGSFRLYRTAAGLRVLATDPAFEPGSPAAERLMQDLGADPAFVQLCRAQRSFRARVTPKPWRCGFAAPPSDFPRETPEEQIRFDAWLADYEIRCARFATCRLIEDIGWGRIHEDNAEVVRQHDRLSRAETDLKLA